MTRFFTLFAAVFFLLGAQDSFALQRQVISLDGTWQIAEGTLDEVPREFPHTVLVPGLVDLADPAFANIPQGAEKDPNRDAFWYRREFSVDELPKVARLKIHKVMFGSKVVFNGTEFPVDYCGFAPSYRDVTKLLKKGKNEILIRVGADLASIKGKSVSPFDQEKTLYTPGIFDSVELICSGSPYIENIQTCPDIEKKTVRVQTRLVNTGPTVEANLRLRVKEWKSGKEVGIWTGQTKIGNDGSATLEAEIPIPDCNLWSPESPFLYVIEAETDSDSTSARFGMRSFRFNTKTRFAELNGKPYMMRGNNITLYRFFEDQERGYLPWDKDWVRRLHELAKEMHWNSLRYCIGFPPEFWYDIADEVGILIQDEYPLWGELRWGKEPGSAEIAAGEYARWMRERWNHPCVVIWDACNETITPATGEAIARVRHLDMSNRPWDNGRSAPVEPTDVFEAHAYRFQNHFFRLRYMRHAVPFPEDTHCRNNGVNAVVVNEYDLIWVNRDGTPSALGKAFYDHYLEPDATAEQRFYLHATMVAAMTEFLRAHRGCAAVMHFTMLGYSRPGKDGYTSDSLIDVPNLVIEPNYYKYVRDSFAPVGLMLDYWDDERVAGRKEKVSVPVVLINDLELPWSGNIVLRMKKGDTLLLEQSEPGSVEALGTSSVNFDVNFPEEIGSYRLEAELTDSKGEKVISVRDFKVVKPEERESLFVREVETSSVPDSYGHGKERTVDGRFNTWWHASIRDDKVWLLFELLELMNWVTDIKLLLIRKAHIS